LGNRFSFLIGSILLLGSFIEEDDEVEEVRLGNRFSFLIGSILFLGSFIEEDDEVEEVRLGNRFSFLIGSILFLVSFIEEDDEVEVEGDFAIALFFDITCDNFLILSILLSELPLFLFIIDLTI
jgi:lipid-A-disaccharide synthase-like uncharacterized protein